MRTGWHVSSALFSDMWRHFLTFADLTLVSSVLSHRASVVTRFPSYFTPVTLFLVAPSHPARIEFHLGSLRVDFPCRISRTTAVVDSVIVFFHLAAPCAGKLMTTSKRG